MGQVFVCETFRQGKGVEDNRKHLVWLEDDLAAQSVADRLAMFRKHLGEKVHDYSEFEDRYQSFATVSLLLLITGMVLPTRITKIESKDASFK